jgi:hypothetical protein
LESFETVLAFREEQKFSTCLPLEEYRMKHLFRILFALALCCGCFSHARADSTDFHMMILDPAALCSETPSECIIEQPNVPFTVTLAQSTCDAFGLGSFVPEGTPYGCFLGTNATGQPITSLDLSFLTEPLGSQDASCSTGGVPGFPGAFTSQECSVGPTVYDLSFGGGSGLPELSSFIIFETGADPADFEDGSGSVGVTPEPDSLLLFGTGVMMAGLFLARQRRMTATKVQSGGRI